MQNKMIYKYIYHKYIIIIITLRVPFLNSQLGQLRWIIYVYIIYILYINLVLELASIGYCTVRGGFLSKPLYITSGFCL